MSFRTFSLIFWIVVVLTLIYLYYFETWIFYRIFYEYGGPGGPFVNSPRG